MNRSHDTVPLCVDLDGTLIRTDVLLESFLGLVKASPLRALRALTQLRRGRAEFKQQIADQVDLDATVLPYDDEIVAYLEEAFPTVYQATGVRRPSAASCTP